MPSSPLFAFLSSRCPVHNVDFSFEEKWWFKAGAMTAKQQSWVRIYLLRIPTGNFGSPQTGSLVQPRGIGPEGQQRCKKSIGNILKIIRKFLIIYFT
jgi:hypothetical protein